jgi:BirA family biotin operon repressor/biotin-[acetyl-CoA-carboxylase] ligase
MPLDVAAIAAARPGNELHYLPSVDSTMSEAARLVTSGAPHGTVVIADEQAAGIGRLGRTWHSESEVGIYASILLRLPVTAASLPPVTLLLGLATREAIQQTTQAVCDLRWPNDVLIGGRKVAGILAQLVDGCVVAGIGINVNQTVFPDDLRTPATSLLLECGAPQNREALLSALLSALDSFSQLLQQQGSDGILRAFSAASSYASNRRVILEDTGEHGTTAGLDESGFLLIRLDSGKLERLVAGGIRPEQA